jgi:alanyl-tRNA synthetase
MKGPEIRQSFLDFFRAKQHQIVPSASVVPHDDPTLYFTNAGMNQFKPYFLGQATPEHRRVADTQKCIRVSGKHNDLEEVGYDTYHHTFFEMLGNWSFGDYYKREAISWAWELMTTVWKLPKERLYATVFGGDGGKLAPDTEAEKLWTECTDIDPTHIMRFGKKDNFWMMGATGPCGPCSEIHIDLTPDCSGGHLVNAGSPLVMELWNLVFIQFNAELDESLRELPAKHVDTGMGFERVCAVMECTNGAKDFTRPVSNYDTEVFRPILQALEQMSGHTYVGGMTEDPTSIAMRVIADHIRMVSFSLADGANPSNEGRGYVIRRILRRAARYGRQLGLKDPFLYKLVAVLEASMGHVFPELSRERQKLENVIKSEEESFNQTLDRGLTLFEEELQKRDLSSSAFPTEAAFKLYDTFGFPVDLTALMARERGLTVDEAGVDALMQQQKERGRAAHKTVHEIAELSELHLPPTPFLGFEQPALQTRVAHINEQGKVRLAVLEQTPFYAEMGGQLGDTGWLTAGNGERIAVTGTSRKEGVFFHQLSEGSPLQTGDEVKAEIDGPRRQEIQRHHTATHLLNWALREVLGTSVRQQGSLVAPDRLRFDFTHYQQVTPEQLRTIERMINERVLDNTGVSWFEIPITEKPDSVVAFFGDKYGSLVRVVNIGGHARGRQENANFDGFSMELCGGTHTVSTGELGPFRINSEGAIASGIRRIEAVVGTRGLQAYTDGLNSLERTAHLLGVGSHEVEGRVEQLLELQKKLQKQIEQSKRAEAKAEALRLLESSENVGEVSLITANLGDQDAEYLRWVSDQLRNHYQGVLVLAGTAGGKVSLLALVHPNLVKRGIQAGALIKEVAKQVGGGGGGRPDLAEAGGKNPAAVPSALASVREWLQAKV